MTAPMSATTRVSTMVGMASATSMPNRPTCQATACGEKKN